MILVISLCLLEKITTCGELPGGGLDFGEGVEECLKENFWKKWV
jgi:hypothetical protein